MREERGAGPGVRVTTPGAHAPPLLNQCRETCAAPGSAPSSPEDAGVCHHVYENVQDLSEIRGICLKWYVAEGKRFIAQGRVRAPEKGELKNEG